MDNKLKIPKLAHSFFKFYCKSDMYEELHGDLEEFFNERSIDKGLFKARLLYVWDVIRCFQPYAWKTPKGLNNSNIIMFNNYFKTSLRTMIKNPLTSFINVFGLAVAIGICMVVYSFMDNDYGIDRFHENKDEVYLSTFYVDREGSIEQYGKSPAPLAEMMLADYSKIKNVTRIHDAPAVVKYEDYVFNESIRFTDPAFLEMMTFPLKWGQKSSLQQLNNIILSENTAIKYFGDKNPVGRSIHLIFNQNRSKTFTVSGVAESFPNAHIIDFEFLTHFDNLKIAQPDLQLDSWKTMLNATLLHIEKKSDLAFIQQEMDKYISLQNSVEKDWPIHSFDFVTIHDLHLASKEIKDDISFDGTLEGRIVLPIIALFMIMLACFNYINIAIVSAAKRLKEIGLRKVIGANRQKVIFQFVSENVFVTFMAGLIGLSLSIFVFLPWFVNLSGMPLTLSVFDTNLWLFLFTILLFTGVLSGIYPALYISKFSVVNIFKGSVRFGKKNPVTKIFLGTQLILACIGITGAVMFTQNSAYQAERSWGYDQENALYTQFSNAENYHQLKSVLENNPDVISISGAKHHLGKQLKKTVLNSPDHQYEAFEMEIGSGYFNTMGLEMKEGRTFRENQSSDFQHILVNETFVEITGLENPISTVFKIDSARYEIIGVVKDFHFNNFYYENRPTIMTMAKESDYQFLVMNIRPGTNKKVYESLQKNWSSLYPELPFQGGYQDEVWVGFQEDLLVMKKFTTAVAIILILLAALGLYGLVKLNVSGRAREFSIRKVLGADFKSIAKAIYKQYIVLSLVALFLGVPISHVLITANIDMMFPDPRPFGYSGVTLAVIILLSVLLLVIASQIRKVLKSNPVNGLKTE